MTLRLTRVVSAFRRFGVRLLVVAGALCVPVAAQAPLEFDVASIKRNDGTTPGGSARSMPDGSEVMVNFAIQQFIGAAYPSQSGEYIGLPDWARFGGERYDVTVKPPPGATRDQRQLMWRTFFADRMKLVAHDETVEQPIYNLVVARADGRLGPNMKPSTHDCIAESNAARERREPPTLPKTDADFLDSCGYRMGAGQLVGGINMDVLATVLRGMAGRVVRNRTNLDGWWAVTFTYGSPSPGASTAADPSEPPSVFTALQEQLGLKLESDRMPLQRVVIDRIERPSEN